MIIDGVGGHAGSVQAKALTRRCTLDERRHAAGHLPEKDTAWTAGAALRKRDLRMGGNTAAMTADASSAGGAEIPVMEAAATDWATRIFALIE